MRFNGSHVRQSARHSDSASIGEASHKNLVSWLVSRQVKKLSGIIELNLDDLNISALLLQRFL